MEKTKNLLNHQTIVKETDQERLKETVMPREADIDRLKINNNLKGQMNTQNNIKDPH